MTHIITNDRGAYFSTAFNQKIVSLSGGFGSEINRIMAEQSLKRDDAVAKGSSFSAPLEVPHIVKNVHDLYACAGADILTADTFNASVSRQKNHVSSVQNIIEAASGAAYQVASAHAHRPLVSLSLTSSGDCYRPEETPLNDILIKEHKSNISLLKNNIPIGKVPVIFAETLPTVREAKVIADIAQALAIPFLVAFVVDDNGIILDGSSMAHAVDTILKPNSFCLGVAVNCCTVKGAQKSVQTLGKIFQQADNRSLNGKVFGAYPNGFKNSREENCANDNDNEDGHGHCHDYVVYTPGEFLEIQNDFIKAGANIIGGCCGSTPAHTKVYSQLAREISALKTLPSPMYNAS